MEKHQIPAVAVAVIDKDKIVLTKTFGQRKIGEKQPQYKISQNDFFHLGSNTKAITSFVAAKLVEETKIQWDTLFFELFPEFKNEKNLPYHQIALADLLSHRAKIQPFTSGYEFQQLPIFKGNTQERRTEFVQYVLTLPPAKYKEGFHYSNAGYSVVATMLEKVSGKSWEDLVKQYLHAELGLKAIFGSPIRYAQNQPFGHWEEDGKIVAVASDTNYDLSLIEPGGDVSMPIKDYAKFVQIHILGLLGQHHFLKKQTFQYLHTAQKDYAMGWANTDKISEHTGSDGTFFCYTKIDRAKHLGYIIIVNSGTEQAQKGVFEILEVLEKYK